MPSPHEVEVFCCRYVANGNATQAYVEAIPRAASWKRRSASRKAVDLMKRPAVRARVDALQELMTKTSDATFVAIWSAISEAGMMWTFRRQILGYIPPTFCKVRARCSPGAQLATRGVFYRHHAREEQGSPLKSS